MERLCLRRGIARNRDTDREDAVRRLRALAWTLPPGFRFSRDDANGR